jgi:RNA polymerase sigma factor (TIGR02999 family)
MPQPPQASDVTALLVEWRRGDTAALERLVPLVYAELRKLARAQLRRELAGHSVQATALVHEVYIRLVNVNHMTVESRAHFMAIAARLMRQILVDRARRKLAGKRGGTATLVSLDDVSPEAARARPADLDVLALNEALDELASFDADQCRIVELRFFGGLTIEETAQALEISTATVEREWVIAKAWLYQRLAAAAAEPRGAATAPSRRARR